MPESALKIELFDDFNPHKDPKELIFETHTNEIIIGLCGPIGTDIHFIADAIKTVAVGEYDYQCRIIKLSDLIRKHNSTEFTSLESPFENYQKLIDCGNKLRGSYKKSILAELAINEIAVEREKNKQGDKYDSQRICYIIDSIKNKEELNLFRLIYREIFYFIGVYSSIDVRVKTLTDKGVKEPEVYQLFDRDSGEEFDYGQKVGDTFVEADFFLRVENHSQSAVAIKVKRLFNLIFSSEVVTPSIDETAMYLASAAAGNSACLSRQVGAAITDSNGEVISVGWNDVPKAGGGVYNYDPNDPVSLEDKRCAYIKNGICYNDKEKATISDLLVSDLLKANLITAEQKIRFLV